MNRRVKDWRETVVLPRPLILIISRCFAEDGIEMYQHVIRTCKACRAVVFAHKTIVLLPTSLLKLPSKINSTRHSTRDSDSCVFTRIACSMHPGFESVHS